MLDHDNVRCFTDEETDHNMLEGKCRYDNFEYRLVSGSRSRSLQLQPRVLGIVEQVCVAGVETRSIRHEERASRISILCPRYVCNTALKQYT